jgi:hypothetical protein
MVKLSQKVVDLYNKYDNSFALHSGIVTGVLSGCTYQYMGDPLYHFSGFVSTAIARAVDVASTLPCIKLMNTQQFRDNPTLQEMYSEQNKIIGKHPTMSQYQRGSTLSSLLLLTLGTIFPAAGYAYLTAAPILAGNNKAAARNLEADLRSAS